jgi:hypothetical protein
MQRTIAMEMFIIEALKAVPEFERLTEMERSML